MSDRLPKFEAPPVVETVLSAQFAHLPNFSTALAGWFWKRYLSAEWAKAKDAPRIEDQFERFDQKGIVVPPLAWRISREMESQRVQLIRSDDQRMIQIQNTRFILNWRKAHEHYPTYEVLLPDFREHFAKFQTFAQDAGLGNISINQWEVTYVNHLPKGELWNSPCDWEQILPGLYTPAVLNQLDLETLSGQWRFSLSGKRGRLYIAIQHRRLAPNEPDTLVIQLTARGFVDTQKGWSLESGFDLGHEHIVRTFASITSEQAQVHWRRKA